MGRGGIQDEVLVYFIRLGHFHPLYYRVKVLCMWYNITMQLHQKVDQLGQILVGNFFLAQNFLKQFYALRAWC